MELLPTDSLNSKPTLTPNELPPKTAVRATEEMAGGTAFDFNRTRSMVSPIVLDWKAHEPAEQYPLQGAVAKTGMLSFATSQLPQIPAALEAQYPTCH